MRLIPNLLLDTNSSAEAKIFSTLRDLDLGDQWTCFHSVNCSEHEYKHWCEIDFLLVGPPGVFVLEVKGGRIELQDGVWTYIDRYDKEHRNAEGPFRQARSAMYAIREVLGSRYGLMHIARDTSVFGFGVVFPDIAWTFDSIEMPRVLVADYTTCCGAEPLRQYIRRLIAYWYGKHSRPEQLTASELSQLRQKIRPDVDVYPPFSARVGYAMRDMQRLTDEQYERLEIIESNERVVVSGGAGTGKTYLLIQCARREVALGNQPLIVTESRNLAAHLRRLEPDSRIVVASVDKAATIEGQFDVLFVDEGQDVMTMEDLDLLSARLKGGIERGRWRWFMDENNQAHVSGRFDSDAFEYLIDKLPSGRPVRVPLRRNVRNTREIIGSVHSWTGADVGQAQFTGHGDRPKIVVYADESSLTNGVAETIEALLDGGLRADHIGIVVPSDSTPPWFSMLPAPIRGKLLPIDPTTIRAGLFDRICWGTPRQFKGLERPVIVAAGFSGARYVDGGNVAEYYVATTRPNYALYIFCDHELARIMQSKSRFETVTDN